MNNPSKEHINMPEGPWGLSGINEDSTEKKTHVPAGKKLLRNHRRDKQAKLSRKANRS